MKREILITGDGSTTIRIPDWDENYHSSHGAIQEAKHVFIANGLDCFQNHSELAILEIGFGTGLNTFITFLETLKKEKVHYVLP
jgi:tRNA U34 5-methylaminomethyl-2-thiouridine-forming methyltransferase MnmC